jgi:hypothetical protein
LVWFIKLIVCFFLFSTLSYNNLFLGVNN